MKTSTFLTESIKNFSTIGAVAPCSPAAAERRVESIDFAKARTIVELGGGTGPVTKEILKHARPDAKIFVFEINQTFVDELRKIDDARLTVLHESAADARHVLENHGVTVVDCIISTLPLAVLDDTVVSHIFTAIKDVLRPGGVYTQIQYSPLLKKRLESEFGTVETLFTPLNVPPAFVYAITRPHRT